MRKSILYLIYAAALLVLLYFTSVLNAAMSFIAKVTAPIQCQDIILFSIGLVLMILVEVLRRKYPLPKPKPRISDTPPYPLYNDQPTHLDTYGRTATANLLISKIFSTFHSEQRKGAEGSIVININEAYGFGKTFFLKLIESKLSSDYQGQNILINFRPWLCDSEQAIIRELFTQLRNSLDIATLRSDIMKYLQLLLLQSKEFAPFEIKPLYSLLPDPLRDNSLQQLHDSIKHGLQTIDRPIIITIDDVDRLHDKELTAVLKLIRDTADFPNIFYIVAADNEYLKLMLEHQGVKQPEVFLQKFFNLDFLLPAHESVPIARLKEELCQVLNKYGYDSSTISQVIMPLSQFPRLNKIFTNMREVYRFLNIYSSSLDMLQAYDNLNAIDPYELFCLTIIRHLRTDVYKKLRDQNDEFLEVISRDNIDSRYHLKEDVNIDKIRRTKEILRNIAQARGGSPSKEEKEREREKAEKRSLNDAIALNEVSYDEIVAIMLDSLFGRVDQRGENSICRINAYFLYFSGRIESNKLTMAQTIDIIRKKQPDYEKALQQLLESNRSNALFNNFSFAYHSAQIDKIDALRKFYTLLKFQHNYRKEHDPTMRSAFEEYISRYHDSYFTFLYELYGRHSENSREEKDSATEALMDFCRTEPDLHLIALTIYIFSSRLDDFSVGDRNFIVQAMSTISDRLIQEKMANRHITDVKAETFETIRLLKDEFSIKDSWLKKFQEFLCQDEKRCRQWLGSMVNIYSNGNVDWNYHRHDAILGEYANSGEELLEAIKQKFPDCSEAIEELKFLQKHTSLDGIISKDSKYMELAREAYAQ